MVRRRRNQKEMAVDLVLIGLRERGVSPAQNRYAQMGAERMYDFLEGAGQRKLRKVRKEFRDRERALEAEVTRLQRTLQLRPGRPRVFDDDGSHVS